MQFAVGSYTGNDADPRNIAAGVGGTPDLVIVKRLNNFDGFLATSTMTGDLSAAIAESTWLMADYIQAMLATGFQVGGNALINGAGLVYHWMAWRNNGAGDFAVGSYVGDGTNDRTITATGISGQVTFACVKAHRSLTFPTWRIPEINAGGENGMSSFYAAAEVALNRIQDLGSGSFQVGSDNETNANGTTYHWFAFTDIPGSFETGTYVGNAADDRSIAVGFQPDLVLVKHETNAQMAVWHPSSLAGDATLPSYGASFANSIQAFEANGFQIGTHGTVNTNSANYYWAAWKAGITVASAYDALFPCGN